MNTFQSSLSLGSLRAVTTKLLTIANKLDKLVQQDGFPSCNCTSSARRIQTTSVFYEPQIFGTYTKRRDFIVYVSAPITAEHPYQREQNINIAKEWAKALWSAGFTVICPQANTAFMDGIPNMEHGDWLEGDFNMIERCVDAAVFVNGWFNSVGCKAEEKKCNSLGITTFNLSGMAFEPAVAIVKRWADLIVQRCRA